MKTLANRLVLALAAPAALLMARPLAGAGGEGTFRAPLRIATGPSPVTVATGDFNHDGRLDLAVANGSNQLTVLLQDPANRLRWTPQPALSPGGFFIQAADFDGDGHDDLVAADPGTTAYVFRSKGDGSFEAAVTLTQSRGARWVTVGDWNGDGKLDLATANYDSF